MNSGLSSQTISLWIKVTKQQQSRLIITQWDGRCMLSLYFSPVTFIEWNDLERVSHSLKQKENSLRKPFECLSDKPDKEQCNKAPQYHAYTQGF